LELVATVSTSRVLELEERLEETDREELRLDEPLEEPP
jgi:hypothetical protein